MNKEAAYLILERVLASYRESDFDALLKKVGKTERTEILGPSNVLYTIDTSISWTGATQTSLVIRSRIDDQNSFRSAPMEEKIVISTQR